MSSLSYCGLKLCSGHEPSDKPTHQWHIGAEPPLQIQYGCQSCMALQLISSWFSETGVRGLLLLLKSFLLVEYLYFYSSLGLWYFSGKVTPTLQAEAPSVSSDRVFCSAGQQSLIWPKLNEWGCYNPSLILWCFLCCFLFCLLAPLYPLWLMFKLLKWILAATSSLLLWG